MTIGIDLTPLQGPHRMRGIGATLFEFVNNISAEDRKKHKFIFYILPLSLSSHDNPLESINTKGMQFQTVYMSSNEAKRMVKTSNRSSDGFILLMSRIIPSKIKKVRGSTAKKLFDLRHYRAGDKRISGLENLDVYIQADQSYHLPNTTKCKKVLIIYDLIPYILEKDYLNTYSTARAKNHSLAGSLNSAYYRWAYKYKLKISTSRADKLISISETTANDFMRILGVNSDKIAVVPLGVNKPKEKISDQISIKRHVSTTWCDTLELYSLKKLSYVLYVGGTDSRRKIGDLVNAFNRVRATGRELKLVLAGDILTGADHIPDAETRIALQTSSYKDDIVFLGYVDNKTRDWLYKNALTFVFPSRYEGFGLPVLEAFSYGTPVIAYRNLAIEEVAGDLVHYAKDANDIKNNIVDLYEKKNDAKARQSAALISHAKEYNWSKTSANILEQVANDTNS